MTTTKTLGGVIAAITTAIDDKGEPDSARSTTLARFLLANGCDGLNVLGTTGEATSFSLDQRKRVMSAYAASGLPLDRMMVGTGAAALADAIALTRHAAELGFAGALVLPPFYYKGVPDDGLVAYIDAIVAATAARPIPIYLYHFPAQSGLHWHVALIRRLLDGYGERIVGLKDSSGDMAYAREAASISPRFKVFPSTEAALPEARSGPFAGCISATANLNADLCARAYRSGDAAALAEAVTIRKLFDGKALVRAHPTPTFLTLLSADTDHSFWVPRLGGKTDLIPNHPNQMWIDPYETGLFLGQCAQYCGTQHAKMLLRVYVDSREDFDRWVRRQQQAPQSGSMPGQRIFESTACVNCHTISGTAANGRFGPDLTHLMSRDTIAAGAAANTHEMLRLWIKTPDAIKPGSKMPAMGLSEQDVDAVTAYLETLR